MRYAQSWLKKKSNFQTFEVPNAQLLPGLVCEKGRDPTGIHGHPNFGCIQVFEDYAPKESFGDCDMITRWWQLIYFLIFTPKIGEDEANLTHIFSKGLKPPTSIVR